MTKKTIRKQLHITQRQQQEIDKIKDETGMTEAEIIRRMLDFGIRYKDLIVTVTVPIDLERTDDKIKQASRQL